MKIGIAQQNYIIGDFEGNLAKIRNAINIAHKQNTDLLIFSEMSVCGTPAYDLLYYNDFITRAYQFVEKIAAYSKDKLAVVVGAPNSNTLTSQKPYNSAYFLADGKIQQIVHKVHLSKKRFFEEDRYFARTNTTKLIQYKGKKFLLHIGDEENNISLKDSSETNKLLGISPDFILNISASPFSQGSQDKKRAYVSNLARVNQLSVFFCNTTGAQTQTIFDGGSIIADSKGRIYDELHFFKEEVKTYTLDEVEHNNKDDNIKPTENIALIHDALVIGIRDFFIKSGFKKAVVGLSGGVDSALVVALAVKALGAENVLSILMPSEYSSDHSIKDSLDLVNNLQSPYQTLPIHSTFKTLKETLLPVFGNRKEDLTEENLQARIRGILLMAVSNKLSHIVLNTSNKSEAAVGYGTLYGDMCGALGVIGDLYKTQVYELCEYINKDKETIPKNILTKTPSAELRPEQKDSDSLPPYEILDEILRLYSEKNMSQEEIIMHGFDKEVVNRILGLVRRAEFKRFQTAPLLRVSERSLGPESNFPLVKRNF